MRTNVSFDRVGDTAVNFFIALQFPAKTLVKDLTRGDFEVRLLNPRGVNVVSSTPVAITELLHSDDTSSGIYMTSFIPTSAGEWTLEVYHTTYFPYGKFATHVVYDALYCITNDARVQRRFRVYNSSNNPVATLTQSDFTARLWNPSQEEVASDIGVTITNLGEGSYAADWTMNASGKWLIQLICSYFTYGKYEDVVYIGSDSGDGGNGLVEAICNLLYNDATLRARLETYEFTSGTEEPAIFTTDVFPEHARFPAVIVQRAGGDDFGTKAYEGEDALVRVRLYGDREYDQSRLRRTAELMRSILNRASLTLTNGFAAFRVIASAPELIEDEDGFPGYLVDVRVLLLAQREDSSS
jgi:hypothetical protein